MSGFFKNVAAKATGLQWPCSWAEWTLWFLEGFSGERERDRESERERERESVCVCVCVYKQHYCDIIHMTYSPPI